MTANDFCVRAVGVLADTDSNALNNGDGFVFAMGSCERKASHTEELHNQSLNVIHISGLARADVRLN